MFRTRITEMFGIEHPILAGPMAYLSDAELVAAVSNAGGLGILVSVTHPTAGEFREEIKRTKSLTDKPFAANITLAPVVREVNYEEYFVAAIEEGVRIVETSARSPEPYMKMLKDAGVKVMHRATRTRDIVKAEGVGVDAVTILGIEAAGLPGIEDVTSLVRIPVAVDAVKIPVIAAGGIGDARGFVAALALGAEGVLMGTRFLASQECKIHPRFKEKLLQLTETDTMTILRSIKNTERVIRTGYTEKILEMEQKGATLEELLPMVVGERLQKAYAGGEIDDAPIATGQVVGLVHDIPSVKEVIDGIIGEARGIAGRLHGMGTG